MTTHRQKIMLEALRRRCGQGFSPTFRELAADLGWKSINGVSEMLGRLKARGLVVWEPGCPRTLCLTQAGEAEAMTVAGVVLGPSGSRKGIESRWSAKLRANDPASRLASASALLSTFAFVGSMAKLGRFCGVTPSAAARLVAKARKILKEDEYMKAREITLALEG